MHHIYKYVNETDIMPCICGCVCVYVVDAGVCLINVCMYISHINKIYVYVLSRFFVCVLIYFQNTLTSEKIDNSLLNFLFTIMDRKYYTFISVKEGLSVFSFFPLLIIIHWVAQINFNPPNLLKDNFFQSEERKITKKKHFHFPVLANVFSH